jgi:hypothetical protein
VLITITVIILSVRTFLSTLDFKYFYSPLFVLRQIFFFCFCSCLKHPCKDSVYGYMSLCYRTPGRFTCIKLAQQSICFPCNVYGNIATLFFHFFFLVNVVINHLCALCNCLKYLCLFDLDVIEPSIIQFFKCVFFFFLVPLRHGHNHRTSFLLLKISLLTKVRGLAPKFGQ